MEIVAEIGINHCGSEARAEQLLSRLVKTNVSAITFQVREKSFYDQTHPRKVELSDGFYKHAIDYVHKHDRKIAFAIAQPEKLELLDKYGTDFWKTLSWDLSNMELQHSLQRTNKIVYVSTGISSLDEIKQVALQLDNIILIHTQLTYNMDDVNVTAIQTVRHATGKEVGFGLHNEIPQVMYVALAMKPSAIFFYVKDDTDGEHPDDAHAIQIDDVDDTANCLISLSQCVGDGKKLDKENVLHPDDDNVCKTIISH